jgi:hypothetical protein
MDDLPKNLNLGYLPFEKNFLKFFMAICNGAQLLGSPLFAIEPGE